MMRRNNLLIIIIISFLFIGILLAINLIPLYIDWLWFNEVNLGTVFITVVSTKIVLGIAGAILFFIIIYINILYARKYKPIPLWHPWKIRFQFPHFDLLARYLNLIIIFILALISILVGFNTASIWDTYLPYRHAVSFNISDPIFQKDISFYVFKLPLLSYLQNWLFTTLILATIAVIIIYIIKQGVHYGPRGFFIEKRPRIHIGILAAFLFLLKGWDLYLERFYLLFSERGIIYGAGYADVNVDLPALYILTVISIIAAGAIIYNAYKGGFRVSLGAVALLILIAIIGKVIMPDVVQRYKVIPNEIVLEQEYIKYNIKFSRFGYGLNRIEEKEFPAAETLTMDDIVRNDLTIKNVRLWDHRPLLSTYRQLQQIRTYYDFVDIDNDRYSINGEYRQIMLSPRELSYKNLPSRIWINEHLTYTHGYGVTLGPVNMVTKEGLPVFFVKDIPPRSTVDIVINRPEIYYGEIGNEYVFVNTNALEFDYPLGDQNKYTTYEGNGGVPIDSLFKKLAFATYFGTAKILLSPAITSRSRIMYHRNIMERVKKAAPFLLYDRDPYMVISKSGKLYWIVDAYTATSLVPYSHPVKGLGNYIRNSVKVVINAYDGSMNFYISDPDDPVIQTYSSIFPSMFKPLHSMPDDIRAHIRYPLDLFSIQARMYTLYHMEDPQIFYNKEDLWSIPRRATGGIEALMEPYYTIMRLPGEDQEEFILMIPYTPAKRDNMAAWLAARSDGTNYGRLIVYIFPKQKLVYGSRQIEARIDQDAYISQQLTLWNQRGSEVIRGSLLVIPVENSLLYVEPLYLAAQAGSIPELRRVIVAFGNSLIMEDNLEAALTRLFGKKAKKIRPSKETSLPLVKESISELANKAFKIFQRTQELQRKGDWAGYGKELKRLESILKEMAERKREQP